MKNLNGKFSKMYKMAEKVTTAQKDGEILVHQWSTGESVSLHDKEHPFYQLIMTGVFPSADSLTSEYLEDIEYLLEKEFLQRSSDPAIQRSSDPAIQKSDKLHLILLPAGEACNLDCVYCYEDHKDKQRMTLVHAERIIQLCQQHLDKKIHIDYFGGEPLINIPFIKLLADKLIQYGIKFTASATTNGTLINSQNINTLHAAGVKHFQITLDGSESIHNALRPAFNKKHNSFIQVINGIKAIRDSGFDDINVIIRINANEQMLEQENINSFLKVLGDLIIPSDSRFTLLPRLIGDYASANKKSSDLNNEENLIYCSKKSSYSVVSVLEEEIAKLGYTLEDSVAIAVPSGYACYAGKPSSFVITPDFLVRKCTVAFNDPINTVGEISSNGTLLANENMELWTNSYKDSYCTSCFLENTCGGNSCPLLNIKTSKKNCPPQKKNPEFATIKIVEINRKHSI